MRSFAFVVPRFGPEIFGGAETLISELAAQLSERGDQITVYTTCAQDNRTWENHYKPGSSKQGGITLKRFLCDSRDLDQWISLQTKIVAGLILPVEQQLQWLAQSVNSSALYKTLLAEENLYQKIIFAPYLFGTSFWGALAVADKAVLLPCLHDEVYAYTEVMQSLFRQIPLFIFNAAAEQQLAASLYGKLVGGVVGFGFNEQKLANDNPLPVLPELQNQDYLLYLGRKESGKNLPLLINYFEQALAERPAELGPLKLVIAGSGSLADLRADLNCDPEQLPAEILDLGRVDEAQKQSLLQHCLCFVQPSVNESFSIVLMEAWIAGVAVAVHTDCAVTTEHVRNCGGGFDFKTQAEFTELVTQLMAQPKEHLLAMGQRGQDYVRQKYNWPEVLKRFDQVICGE